jgi:hypothetical protein
MNLNKTQLPHHQWIIHVSGKGEEHIALRCGRTGALTTYLKRDTPVLKCCDAVETYQGGRIARWFLPVKQFSFKLSRPPIMTLSGGWDGITRGDE